MGITTPLRLLAVHWMLLQAVFPSTEAVKGKNGLTSLFTFVPRTPTIGYVY
jgi:hypothetical protein